MRLNLSAVRRRGGEFEAAVMAAGRVVGRVVEVAIDDYNRLAKLKPERVIKPIAHWPVAMRLLARHRQPGERGLGDTAARWIGHVGGDKFKLWFHVVFGRDCGCADRQQWLNNRWPYPSAPPE